MRAPDGDLLVRVCTPPGCGEPLYDPYWRDVTTGREFSGDSAAVSPDGSRIATLVTEPNRQEAIRQYDFSTGRELSDLTAGVEEGYGNVLGFDWTPDSQSLVVAVAPGYDSKTVGGLYVVNRDARHLPQQPTLADTVPGRSSEPYAYGSPAVLANGHVVAFEYQFPIQHDAWGGAFVDIDLRTGVVHTVLGSTEVFESHAMPACGTIPGVVPSTTSHGPSCYLFIGGSIDARGDRALFTDDNGGAVFVYDGLSVRRILAGSYGTAAYW